MKRIFLPAITLATILSISEISHLDAAERTTSTLSQQLQQSAENVNREAQTSLEGLKEERSWSNDLYYGYNRDQQIAASIELAKLNALAQKVYTTIKNKEKERLSLKDYFFVKSGKETEYKNLSEEIEKLKNILKKIAQAIRNREIITGKRSWWQYY